MELGTYNPWNSHLSTRETACKVHQVAVSATHPCWWLLTVMRIILLCTVPWLLWILIGCQMWTLCNWAV